MRGMADRFWLCCELLSAGAMPMAVLAVVFKNFFAVYTTEWVTIIAKVGEVYKLAYTKEPKSLSLPSLLETNS